MKRSTRGELRGTLENKELMVKTHADLFIFTVKTFAVFMQCLWPMKIFLQWK